MVLEFWINLDFTMPLSRSLSLLEHHTSISPMGFTSSAITPGRYSKGSRKGSTMSQLRTNSNFHSFGYPITFLERRRLLEILYNALPDKTKVKVNKTVSDIEQYSEGGKYSVRIRTLDGDVYEGDLVVGADGVHSQTRREMWRLSGSSYTGDIPFSERNGMILNQH